MRKLNLAVAVLGVLAAAALPQQASAVSGYYTSQGCSGCHGSTPTTCNGCHQHGPGGLSGSLSGTSFTPGQSFNVTVNAGTRSGWWRAAVLDASNNVVGQVSMTASGAAVVAVTAPTAAGTYTWKAAWYGNEYPSASGSAWVPDPGNSSHGYQTVALASFRVAAVQAPAPVAALSASSLAFGNVSIGQSGSRTASVTNTGNAALSVTAVTPCSNTAPPFGLAPGAPFSVAAGGSQVLTATFAPSSSGAVTGCFDLATNDAAHPSLRLTVTGTGTTVATPSASLAPAALSFGSVTVGQATTLTATVANSGAAALSVTGVTACDSSNAASLTVTPTTAFSVAAGASRALTVRFAPTAAGAAAACWNVATSDPAHPTLQLTAGGTGAAVTPPPTDSCTTCHAIPPATGKHAYHVTSKGVSCATCHGSGYSTTTVNASTHANGTVNLASAAGWSAAGASCANACHGTKSWGTVAPPPPPTTSCTSCHAIPPASGRHALHKREGVGCRSCHGSGYSTTTVVAATHANGKVNISSRAGWKTSSRSCANSCHGTERWGSGSGSSGGHDREDDDYVIVPDEEAAGGCSSTGGATTVLALLGVAALGLVRRRRRG